MKGVGCDIVSIRRIEEKIVGQRFLNKVYTVSEQERIASRGAATAAGLWAAKEAACKALGTGFVGYTARDIEIGHSPQGQPCVELHNGAKAAADLLNIKKIHLSISHDGDYALATAFAE